MLTSIMPSSRAKGPTIYDRMLSWNKYSSWSTSFLIRTERRRGEIFALEATRSSPSPPKLASWNSCRIQPHFRHGYL